MDRHTPKDIELSNDHQELKEQYKQLLSKHQETLDEFVEIEKMLQAKNAFLANLSHDLRTPLHAILSYSRFGIDKIDRIDTEKIVKYFKGIEESGKNEQHR